MTYRRALFSNSGFSDNAGDNFGCLVGCIVTCGSWLLSSKEKKKVAVEIYSVWYAAFRFMAIVYKKNGLFIPVFEAEIAFQMQKFK